MPLATIWRLNDNLDEQTIPHELILCI